MNWSRIIRRAVVRTTRKSSRWVTKPYRDEAARNAKRRSGR